MPSRAEIYLQRLWEVFHFNPIGAHNDGLDISAVVELAAPVGASKIMFQALDQNVRFTLDGTDPTISLGFQFTAGDPPVIMVIESRATIKFIEEAATADLQYQWGL